MILPLALLLAVSPIGDLLMLAALPLGPGIPSGWSVRPVRGRHAPAYTVVGVGDQRALRIEGEGGAAWLYRTLDTPVEGGMVLSWSWRVLQAPRGADLRAKRRDDSPVRVFVVFGRLEDIGRSARAIFYSWGGTADAGVAALSHVSPRIAVVRLRGSVDADGTWHDERIDPFLDHERIFGMPAGGIGTIGIMQDTDQTGDAASAELRSLAFEPALMAPLPGDVLQPSGL